jgi:iron complex outermembrane receptor protein
LSIRISPTRRARRTLLALCLTAVAVPAGAQRTDDNAVTSADDAFGTSVGNYGIGLYNPFDVRGFSAVDAGNIRLDGLYIDRQSGFTAHLVAGSTIRVGLSAQGYPFPAPTGIADFRLRKGGDQWIFSPAVNVGPFGTREIEFDAQMPLAPTLSLAAGAGFYYNQFETGIDQSAWSAAISARWRPTERIEIVPFASRVDYWGGEAFPLIFTDGTHLPTKFARGRFYGQEWAENEGINDNHGIVSSFGLSKSLTLRAGLFRSAARVDTAFAEIFADARQDGTARHFIVANPPLKFASWSGEARLSQVLTEGPRRHVVHLSARGRDQKRRYGGGDFVDLGLGTLGEPNPLPEPAFAFGPQTEDRIRQTTFGIAYEGRWRDAGELILGLQKTDYEKRIEAPAVPETISRDSPWLFNAGAAAYVTGRLSLYASYTRGLEEGGVAPSSAVNRDEAAPALRTEQKDAGLRYELSDNLRFVAGVFDVRKPYYSVDSTNLYRRLGEVRNRGVELSLAGTVAPGLSTVLGAVLLDPEVSGEEVDRGLIGSRPLGSARRTAILNVDYRPPWARDLSVDATVTNYSRRVASADNQLHIPGRAVLDLGGRYRFKVGDAPATLRIAVANVFNKFGWRVDGSGIFSHNAQRRFSLSLAADI